MGQKRVVDGETSTPGLIPSRSFSGVVGKVGVGKGRSPGNYSREEMTGRKSLLVETRFSM